jgi:hypothetical protein
VPAGKLVLKLLAPGLLTKFDRHARRPSHSTVGLHPSTSDSHAQGPTPPPPSPLPPPPDYYADNKGAIWLCSSNSGSHISPGDQERYRIVKLQLSDAYAGAGSRLGHGYRRYGYGSMPWLNSGLSHGASNGRFLRIPDRLCLGQGSGGTTSGSG